MDFINYTLFTIGGDTPVLLIDLLTSVVGLTCVFLAGRNSKYNFWVGYLYSLLLLLMFWNKNLYANLLLQPISLGINVLGHYRWTHPRKEEQSSEDSSALKVTMLGWKQRILAIASVFVIAAGWGWFISLAGNVVFPGKIPSDPIPYLDACVTVLILVAQFLSALKKWDCWIAWLLVNVFQLAMHISVGHVFMPIVCGLYLVNGIWSLITWSGLYKKKHRGGPIRNRPCETYFTTIIFGTRRVPAWSNFLLSVGWFRTPSSAVQIVVEPPPSRFSASLMPAQTAIKALSVNVAPSA